MIKFKVILLLTFAVFLMVACNPSQKDALNSTGKKVVLRLQPGENNPRNSEGDFIQLNDGRILFVYTHFTDGAGDNAQAYLAGRVSENGGKTWSQKDHIIVENEGDFNIMSVSLIRFQDGRIGMFYLRKNSHVDCIPVLRISTDEAKTWSNPFDCIKDPGYYVMNNDRVIQLKNGRITLPLSLHQTPQTELSARGRIMCY
jgi:sialidase-1